LRPRRFANRSSALRHLEKKRIVILAGGTGHPYFTTDTTAALRANEIKAEILLKATKVDGVFSADPLQDKHAVRYTHLSFMEVINKQLKVMDTTAITHCMEYNLPILVFKLDRPGSIQRAVVGEAQEVGTLIDPEGPKSAAP